MPTRRQVLWAAGAIGAGVATGCDTVPDGGKRSDDALLWWDHFQPREKFQKKLFDRFAQRKGGLPVEHTVFNPEKQGQALQLAKSSDQLPDVFTLAGVRTPPVELAKKGWFSPLVLDQKSAAALPDDARYDGLTVFDDKLHSFPVNSPKEYHALVWFHRDLFAKAGLDPDAPPATYDEWRAGARAIRRQGGDGVSGWVLPLGFLERIGDQVETLAQAAGATAWQGRDFRTGEHVYHSEPYLQALEFLLAIKRDGTLFPASNSLDARKGRARWATGAAGMFLDGCYCVGVVNTEFPTFDKDKLGVAPTPTPGREAPAIYRPPHAGTFWIANTSKHVEQATELLSWFIGKEHQTDIATSMASPPHLRSAVDAAKVHSTYRDAVGLFDDTVFVAPYPVVKNPAIAPAVAAALDVKPGFAEVVQGVMAGDVTDHRKALRQLSDSLNAAQEKAMAQLRKDGAANDEDIAFPDWTPRRDYGAASYR
ncbi:MAG: ABC transporter substrate-binding protein [Micromonosporaceae bacterium]